MGLAKQKSSYIFNFRRLPWTVITSILLFFILSLIISRTDFVWRFFYIYSRPAVDHFLRKEAELRLIKKDDNEFRIFILGSSIAYEGYDEDYMNKLSFRKNTKFYNFGSGGVTPIEMFLRRNKYISKRPDIIIIPTFIGDFYKVHDYASLRYFFTFEIIPAIISEFGMKEIYKNRAEIFHSVVGNIIPFYRYHRSIVRTIETAIGDGVRGRNRQNPRKIKKIGQQPIEFYEKIALEEENRFKNTKYTNFYKKMFISFIRDINASGIKVIVVNAPTHRLISDISETGALEELDSFLRSESLKNDFLYIDKYSLPEFTDYEFNDYSHLNEKGRLKNSDFMINYIKSNY